jgi:predicted DNA-binding transcriptional regulator YafY
MAIHKLALLRYKTIDQCLRNRLRRWTLQDLIETVSETIYQHEGIHTGVSRRTIQTDIQIMRSNQLGYNAPIVVVEKKYYTYEDKNYSLHNAPMNEADIQKMKEVVGVLKHLNGFTYFDEMTEVITRLENNVFKSQQESYPIIQFESNSLLKGLEHLNPLYQAVVKKIPLMIEYKSFRARTSTEQLYYPYVLKEYRNRWFVVVKPKKGNELLTLALDRIVSFKEMKNEKFVSYKRVDFNSFFNNAIGVSKSVNDVAHKVVLFVQKRHAPYVLTKPIHESQRILKEDEKGMTIQIEVVLNFELEKEILGFGEHVVVHAPRILKHRIKKRIEQSLMTYQSQ